jgi:hypothetical protein
MEIKIKQVIIKKYDRKTNDYSKIVNLFEKYSVLNVEDTKIGKAINIKGPKKLFRLYENRNGLKILVPPKNEGESARAIKVPLFFVSTMGGSSEIQGASYFALINNELVAYRGHGGSLSPMDINFDYSVLL